MSAPAPGNLCSWKQQENMAPAWAELSLQPNPAFPGRALWSHLLEREVSLFPHFPVTFAYFFFCCCCLPHPNDPFFLSWVKRNDSFFLIYLEHGHTNLGIYTRQGVLSKSEYGSLESITLLAAELHWDWNQCVIIPWCNGRNTELWSFLRLVSPLGSLRYSVGS